MKIRLSKKSKLYRENAEGGFGGVVGGLAAAAGVGLAISQATSGGGASSAPAVASAPPQTPSEQSFNNLQLNLAEQQAMQQTQAETQLANVAYAQQQTAHNVMLYLAVGLLGAMAYFYARKKKIL